MSPEFIFFVGSEQTRLTVHTEVLRRLSPPLYALASNGKMKESTEKQAILQDIDKETFLGFCEFAYRGAYTVPDRKKEDEGKNPTDSNDSGEGQIASEVHSPLPLNIDDYYHLKPQMSNHDIYLTDLDMATSMCGVPISEILEEFTYRLVPSIASHYKGLQNSFDNPRFTGAAASSVSLRSDLLFHAKLYVFATGYLIDSLRIQCLKSLHRDLCNDIFMGISVPHILDLLQYAYEESGRGEPTGEGSLRELVIHYAAAEISSLAKDSRFGRIMDDQPEMGSDLVLKLVKGF